MAVKILRPGMRPSSSTTSRCCDTGAGLLEKLWADGKRLKPREVVAEFEKYLHDELDLMREAANCSPAAAQLRRFAAAAGAGSLLGLCATYGDGDGAHARHRRSPRSTRCAPAASTFRSWPRAGVEIFFTQVFRDGFFHADMHPGNIFVATDPATRPLHRARLRHRRHAHRRRQELPGAELPRLLPPRLQARRRGAHRIRLGAGGHARRRIRGGDPRGVRTDLRPAAEGDFLRPRAAAPVPDLAPLQRRNPAATGAAAKDPAQHRRPGPPARSRARPVEDRQALPRTLDERAGRLARPDEAPADRSAALWAACCRNCRAWRTRR